MGRNKISIQKIKDEKARNLAYYKRKKSLLKKAMELSLLCDVDIIIGAYPKDMLYNKLLLFCSSYDVDYFITNYLKNPSLSKEVITIKDVNHILYNFH